ncbi:hypothetical protein V499_01056 [Pseudogymnoascus sp. VKM F-103]|nr:hypothetical protein V499_01056 [Pseudogymnoascus sp. VKM F-103]
MSSTPTKAELIMSFFDLVAHSDLEATQEACEILWGVGISVAQLALLRSVIQALRYEVPVVLHRAVLCHAWRRSDTAPGEFTQGIQAIIRVGGYISELQRRLQDCRAAGTPLPLWLLQMMTSSLIINLRLPQGNQEVEETLVSILTFSTPEDIERCTFNIMVMAGLVEAI